MLNFTGNGICDGDSAKIEVPCNCTGIQSIHFWNIRYTRIIFRAVLVGLIWQLTLFYICLDASVDILLKTMSYGNENSWSLGDSCESEASGFYQSNQEYHKSCSLPRGVYTLSCKDSYGDGWHGGWITIKGETYCETFTYGGEMTVQVVIGGKVIITISVKFANIIILNEMLVMIY